MNTFCGNIAVRMVEQFAFVVIAISRLDLCPSAILSFLQENNYTHYSFGYSFFTLLAPVM